VTTPEPPTPQPASTPAPLADWGTRALGFIIDWLPIAILNAVLYRVTFVNALAGLIGLGYWLYLGHMEGVTGQTPGKAIMGLRLVNDRGELIGGGPGIGRKVAHVVDSLVCLLGWLLPLVDSKRQTIADKLLQSYVVTGVEKKQFAVDLWMPPQQGTSA
jgi:uncharacterized RDD family membrane protein YckC